MPEEQPIPLAQIANRAEELETSLLRIAKQLSSSQEMTSIDGSIKAQADEIREHLDLLDGLIAGVPTGFELRDQDYYWATLDRQYSAEQKFLTSRGTYLEEQIRFLDAEQPRWQATWDQIHKTAGIEPVADHVAQELNRIRSTRREIQDQLNLVLTLQNEVSQQHRRVAGALSKVGEAHEQLLGHLVERDGYPLWDTRELRKLGQPMASPVLRAADREFRETGDYAYANIRFLLAIVVLYGLTLVVAFKLKNYVSTRADLGAPPETLEIFSRPFSVALLLALLGTIGEFSRVTTSVATIFAWLWLIQALRLVPPLVGPSARSVLRLMVPFWVLESARSFLPLSPALKRQLFLVSTLGAVCALTWLHGRLMSRQPPAPHGRTSRLSVVGVRVGIGLLAASLVSNFFGFVSLSRALGMSAVLGFLGAVTLYSGAYVLSLMLAVGLRSHWLPPVAGAHVRAIELWGRRALFVGAALAWLAGMLRLFAIYDFLIRAFFNFLQRPLGYGNVHFTFGGMLNVLLTMVVGYALARIATGAMKQFVLVKLPLPRGVPYAISAVTYYIILLLVARAALADTGVELDKFTVLTGALGVGLGFGLQNIVNNFISGLILLFERPIHVGDTVEVNGLVGKLRRIGARSSTVLTFQGAEVIVPNSNLISNQVINWTLSSPWRRVDVPVNVAYGSDPAKVLKLLVEVANSHPGVLRERPPTAFFLGFGDSALNFELRFWSATQETWFELRSDVTMAVAKALDEAGIDVPFPQRDLHVRSIDKSVAESLAEKGLRFAPLAHSPEAERSPATMREQGSDAEQSVANPVSRSQEA